MLMLDRTSAPSSATSPPREDNLPWLFVSERQAQLTRQAVNYIVLVAGETAKLGCVWPPASISLWAMGAKGSRFIAAIVSAESLEACGINSCASQPPSGAPCDHR
jgi:hypothetical protein